MPRKTRHHPLMNIAWLLLALTSIVALTACGDNTVLETGSYPEGSPAFEREYRLTADSRRIPHGAHATWYPRGTRRTLEFFKHGHREGYAFEWDETGALIRMEACAAGVCEVRALPDRPIASAAVLAETRFR